MALFAKCVRVLCLFFTVTRCECPDQVDFRSLRLGAQVREVELVVWLRDCFSKLSLSGQNVARFSVDLRLPGLLLAV